MKKETEYLLLSHFRHNARSSLTRLSKQTAIPVSTIFDKLRHYEGSIIHKHTSLLDFRKLGYDLKAHILFKIEKSQRDSFQQFLLQQANVNSVYRINNGYDFLVEAVFVGLKELTAFFDQSEKMGVEARQEFFILEDVIREGFLSYRKGFEELILPDVLKP